MLTCYLLLVTTQILTKTMNLDLWYDTKQIASQTLPFALAGSSVILFSMVLNKRIYLSDTLRLDPVNRS